jgi:hypothetical protein
MAKDSGKKGKTKGKTSGGQASRQRQQQDAAARRRGTGQAPGARQSPQAGMGTGQEPETVTPGGQAAPAAERWYLDVSALRIQEWLARTPRLRFRRGASVLVSEVTEEQAWGGRLPAGTEWNHEAGNVDGVVSLLLTSAPEAPGGPAREEAGEDAARAAAREAAAEVVRGMRERMPCLHIQAVLGHGQSYAQAYEEMKRARRDGIVLLDSPPAPQELILAKPCDQCRSAAAIHRRVEIIRNKAPREPERADLCDDCHRRFEAAGGTRGTGRSPLPERRLRAVLQSQGMAVADFADDFAEVAEGGRFREDDAATQVALVYADGNRVGDFLQKLSSAGRAAIGKSEIARLIDQATIGAVADAVIDRFPGWKRPMMIVHIAGGDDLLISLPAADAWQFTRTLLTAFGTRTGQAASAGIAAPTMSAGLIFAHRTHPFSDLVRIAGRELRTAKDKTRGSEAAISFRDLTADGGEPLNHRVPVTLAYLADHAAALADIEKIPPSRRQALLALLRQGAIGDAIRRLTDFEDNRPLWEVVAGRGATAEQARQELTGSEARHRELRQLLDIARHWRTHPREEAP